MGDSDPGCQFGSGIGADEVARLEVQGAALGPATRMIFAEAGIRPGMRVLDPDLDLTHRLPTSELDLLRRWLFPGEYAAKFSNPGTVAPGQERHESGLRDRSADFERSWTLTSIQHRP